MLHKNLAGQAPTAQVRMLTEEFLADGQVHTRKEIVSYVDEQGALLGLLPFRRGHISGGIQQAVTKPNCRQLSRATYQVDLGNGNQAQDRMSRLERAAEVCKGAIAQMRRVAREIDYIAATEAEMAELKLLKKGVQTLQAMEQELRSSTQAQ